MKKHLRFSLLLFLGLASSALAQPQTQPLAPADQPVPKNSNDLFFDVFFDIHQSYIDRGQSGPIDLLFIGDSITDFWRHEPQLWEQSYGRYHPANFGISGDQTQHVIWRLANGELDGISPRVVVLLIGTNNTAYHSAEQIASGNREIVRRIQEKLPETKILLLGIFPRGPRSRDQPPFRTSEERMAIIRSVNADLSTLDNGNTIRYLDITSSFLSEDGTIPQTLLPDQLHPSAAGYQVWADAMNPLLTEMMDEAK